MITKQIVVATEAIDFCQAIYVDGRLTWEGDTAQALDIVTAVCQGKSATTDPITLRCVNVDLPLAADGFPETLDELRPLVSPVDEPLAPAADEIRPSSRSWDDRDCVCETCSEEFPSCGNHPITCDVCMAYTCPRCLQDQICQRCREAAS